MSDYLLAVPNEFVEHAREVALKVDEPLDELLLDPIRMKYGPEFALPADVQSELRAFRLLTDDTLWTLALERMPADINEEMSTLISRERVEELSPGDHKRLEELLARADRLWVRKGTAAAHLTMRGHDVGPVLDGAQR